MFTMDIQHLNGHNLLLRFLIVTLLISECHGNFNLFLNATETKRILGIEGEIFYVRKNVINHYALDFNVPIGTDTDVLYFTWQHQPVSKSPVSKMLYNVSVAVSNEEALHPPALSLAPSGVVPTTLQAFSLVLQCSYVVTADINVVVTLNVTMFNRTHPTSLQIKRKKTCIQDAVKARLGRGGGDANDIPGAEDGGDGTKKKSLFGEKFSVTSTKFFSIAVVAFVVLIVVVIVCVVIWYMRARKQASERLSDTSSSALTPKTHYTKVDTPSTSVVGLPVNHHHSMLRPREMTTPHQYSSQYSSHSSNQFQHQQLPVQQNTYAQPLLSHPHSQSLYDQSSTYTPLYPALTPHTQQLVASTGSGSLVSRAHSAGTGSNQQKPVQTGSYAILENPNSSPGLFGMQQYGSMNGSHMLNRALPPPIPEPSAQDVDEIMHQIRIDRKKLSLGEILMQGTFGKIYRGTMLIEMDSDQTTSEMDVYVKTVTDAASAAQVDTLLREGVVFSGHLHTHVNPVVAACVETSTPPMLIYPRLSEGNLNTFLHRCRGRELSTQQKLSTQQLVYMAVQLCQGIQYLHSRRILHRDIATRNCVVDASLTVRICDRGLSRALFPGDYHCLGDNDNRPIKWMSIEAITERRYSYASDVWSYGVTLWEILSVGQTPYAEIDPFEMATYLADGYRVSQPQNCPDQLFSVMACCWALNPDERPTMTQLQVCMQDFYAALASYI